MKGLQAAGFNISEATIIQLKVSRLIKINWHVSQTPIYINIALMLRVVREKREQTRNRKKCKENKKRKNAQTTNSCEQYRLAEHKNWMVKLKS